VFERVSLAKGIHDIVVVATAAPNVSLSFPTRTGTRERCNLSYERETHFVPEGYAVTWKYRGEPSASCQSVRKGILRRRRGTCRSRG